MNLWLKNCQCGSFLKMNLCGKNLWIVRSEELRNKVMNACKKLEILE
jgi:hypothetical protein